MAKAKESSTPTSTEDNGTLNHPADVESSAQPGGNEMDGDLTNDSLELLLEQSTGAFDQLAIDAAGSAQSSNDIVRHSAARKFNQEDPIEAAAAEMILQKV